ncbi:MAG: DnaD domain protein, partial [Oscillospiraceae bacterium]|nr:DnaD domain protein [Oscillospiraceae bacterium]
MQGNFADKLISPAAADKLIAAHDGDLALLHIFMQRTGSRDLERAAVELCRTMREIEAAYEKLMRMGLVEEGQSCNLAEREAAQAKLPPVDELPEYRTEDIIRRSNEDGAFSAVLLEAQNVLGHKLSTPDMKKLFGIYDYLALPPEVIMELLHYCMFISENRLPSMRFIEREAYTWANREIITLEQAEEYISRSKQRREETGKVAEALGIRGRQLSPTEKKYISAWLDMGFDIDVILLAFDRTVTNTGGLKWSYMNKILSNWKEKGLSSVAEIEEKDS